MFYITTLATFPLSLLNRMPYHSFQFFRSDPPGIAEIDFMMQALVRNIRSIPHRLHDLKKVYAKSIYSTHSEKSAAFPDKNTLSPKILQYSVPPRLEA